MRIQAGERILAIHEALKGRLSLAARERLLNEQRRLWDANYSGKAFDEIVHDVWLVKRRSDY